jgi:hypothetical protein
MRLPKLTLTIRASDYGLGMDGGSAKSVQTESLQMETTNHNTPCAEDMNPDPHQVSMNYWDRQRDPNLFKNGVFEFGVDADFLKPAVELILFPKRREPTALITLHETELVLMTRTRSDECWCKASVRLVETACTGGAPISFKIDTEFLERLSERTGRLRFRYLKKEHTLEWLHESRSFKDNQSEIQSAENAVRFNVAPGLDDTPIYNLPTAVIDSDRFVEALTYLSVFGAKDKKGDQYYSGVMIDDQQAISYSATGIALTSVAMPAEMTFGPSDLDNMIHCLRRMRSASKLILTSKEIIFQSADACFCTIRHKMKRLLIPKTFSQTPSCKITVERSELVHKLDFLSAIDNRVSFGIVMEAGQRQLIVQRAVFNARSYGHLPGRYSTDEGLTDDAWVDSLYSIKDILGLICRPHNRFVEISFHKNALTIENDQRSGGGRAVISADKK